MACLRFLLPNVLRQAWTTLLLRPLTGLVENRQGDGMAVRFTVRDV